MRCRTLVVAMLVLAPLALPAQEGAPPAPVVVRLEGPNLSAWRAGPAPGQAARVWEALQRTLDNATRKQWGHEVPGLPASGLPVIADYDDDGVNDLLVVDALGLTVYGRTPAYYPFADAGSVPAPATLVVADVDGDRRSEIVTQRSLAGSPGQADRRVIEIWKRNAGGLEAGWRREVDGNISWTLEWADVDNDGAKELLTASDTILIFKRAPGGDWQAAAEFPNLATLIDVVRVGDVDGDGKNEIVAAGNGGVVTVYKHRARRLESGTRNYFPVLWQSPRLGLEGLGSGRPGQPAMAFTQGLALGDVDGDGGALEILAATTEGGFRPGETTRSNGGRVHLFKYDGALGFTRTWVSDWTVRAGIPAFAIADLDGDGRNEFLYNGQTVYARDQAARSFTPRPLCPECPGFGSAVVGKLPELREPISATRIVPVRWSLPGGQLVRGGTASVALTLRSVWAAAADVVVTVSAASSSLALPPQTLTAPAIPAGGVVTLPPFTLAARDAPRDPDALGMAFGTLLVEISAKGGYRQSLRLTVSIVSLAADLRARAEAGNSAAQLELGLNYRTGMGVPADAAQAFAWTLKAARQGNVDAQYFAGAMYFAGEGVARDNLEAYKWYLLAAARSSGDAAKRGRDELAKLLSPAQVAEAQKWANEWTEAFERRRK